MKKLLIALCVLMAAQPTVSAQFLGGIFASKKHKHLTLKAGHHYQATIYTSKGKVTVELFNETPRHRDNFVKLAQSDFYKGILFHRVINNFMVQAGDPSSREGSQVRTYGDNDAGYKLDAEIRPEFFHVKGALAAAREPDESNPEKKSSGSQFYIVVGQVLNDSLMVEVHEKIKFQHSTPMTPERERIYRTIGGMPHLDGNYTIFGQVVKGQKVVDKISKLATYRNDRPKQDIFIKRIMIKTVKDHKKR